jgi:hypothetical protein
MYSYVPGFVTATAADSPGLMTPVVHEPSRDSIVRAVFVAFLNVSVAPAFVRTRGGLMPSSLFHSSRRPAVTTLYGQ